MDEKKDFPGFVQRLAILGEAFGKEVSPTLSKFYWETLKDLSWPQFLSALSTVGKGSKWFPKPVEILEAVNPGTTDRAVIAYDLVLNTAGSVGTYQSVVFDDPAIHMTIEALGGWVEFGQKEPNVWLRKEFERIYSVYAKRIGSNGPSGVPPVLLGKVDRQNDEKFGRGKPVLIGSQEKIQKWLEEAKTGKGNPLLGIPVPVLALEEPDEK